MCAVVMSIYDRHPHAANREDNTGSPSPSPSCPPFVSSPPWREEPEKRKKSKIQDPSLNVFFRDDTMYVCM